MLRYLFFAVLLTLLLLLPRPVHAHASLQNSNPPANASLLESPSEIRLWFTEPVEPDFSRITVYDSESNVVELPESAVDAGDAHQLFISDTDNLPDGVYTVSWRVISSADGHLTEGSFTFGINVIVELEPITFTIDQRIPADGVIVRALNLLSFALLIGGIGFTLFVWNPAQLASQQIDSNLNRMIRGGWVCVGIASLFMLMFRASVSLDASLFEVLLNAGFIDFLTSTEYGQLWIVRMMLWLAIGLIGYDIIENKTTMWASLLFSMGLLITHSVFSHAGNAPDALTAILGDFLHLFGTALWVGGLMAFVVVLVTKHGQNVVQVGRLVAHFSNYARITVGFLIVTGLYALWLNVGSLEALRTTVYGQALIVKLILIVPLLAIAGVNLLITQRRLQSEQVIWVKRLRILVSAEIMFTVSILIAVAVMTSIAPARTVQVQREAIATLEASTPQNVNYFDMETTNDRMFHLEIEPGYVGVNTFVIAPFDDDGELITDASRIRLRFDNLDQNLGQSELRPEYDAELGAYVATGSNLSTAGNWRIRMTLQRPDEFDTVIDFESEIGLAPPPPQLVIDDSIPKTDRAIIHSLIGSMLLGIGGFFLFQLRTYRLLSVGGLGVICVLAGLAFLATGLGNIITADALTSDHVWARPADEGTTTAVYLTLANNTAQEETLIGIESPIADSVEIHRSQVDENDVARMIQLDSITVPAGERLFITPQEIHLMLINLHHDLNEGDTFPLTLYFESGASLIVEVEVNLNG